MATKNNFDNGGNKNPFIFNMDSAERANSIFRYEAQIKRLAKDGVNAAVSEEHTAPAWFNFCENSGTDHIYPFQLINAIVKELLKDNPDMSYMEEKIKALNNFCGNVYNFREGYLDFLNTKTEKTQFPDGPKKMSPAVRKMVNGGGI